MLRLIFEASALSYLRPDISKGITTDFQQARLWQSSFLSTTWHIKRDYDLLNTVVIIERLILIYDLTYQKGLRPQGTRDKRSWNSPYLRPDISKGITTKSLYDFLMPAFSLSTTWHIKRDYDLAGGLDLVAAGVLSTTWHIKRDYDWELRVVG